jgi:hypothetical protein
MLIEDEYRRMANKRIFSGRLDKPFLHFFAGD